MPAYLIVDAADIVTDTGETDQRADEYRVLAQQSIRQFGGRYLVMGASPVALSGEWPAERVVTVVEFPDRATLDRWHASPEYTDAAQIRKTSIDARILLADGIDD
ncbi:DUF1330 domain-containing protein [Nocardia callitridis]|uniref:DUF1330 domain-containing protein n=1 Tax=Nocardia callitridis TaxID=648753 RepID=A0ABP9K6B7_9NOCA